METLNVQQKLNYQDAIEKAIGSFSDMLVQEGTEIELICDRENGHYLVMVVGWNDQARIYGSVVHIDIKGDKIWIQQDRTDTDIAKELVELGVPKTDIVLGYKSIFTRKFTEYYHG
ncbi:MAG: XisI protein [Spirulina sp.]